MRNSHEGHEGRLAQVHRAEYVTLRAVLREEMARRGLGQRELSRQLGRPEVWVNRVMQARRSIEWAELLDLCDAIGADPTEVVVEALRRSRAEAEQNG